MVSNAFEILRKISNTSSLLEKQEILLSNSGNDALKIMLKLAYDPFQQFFLKKVPVVDPSTETTSSENFKEFLIILSELSHRQITGNAALARISDFFRNCNAEEQLWFTRIIQKDLKCGLNIAGINKVFSNLITTYNVQLAGKLDSADLNLDTKKALKILPERIVCQYKIDGFRLNIHRPDPDTVILCTRNGKVVTGYTQLESDALQLPVGYVYDGEIVAPELFDWISLNSGNKELNRDLFGSVMSHAFSKEENKKGIFNIFDIVPLDDWQIHTSLIPYSQRLELLELLVKSLNLSSILVVPTSKTFFKSNPEDLEEIVKLFHEFVSVGWEGLMIKDLDSVYQWKRSKSLIKMKLMDTMDLKVESLFEGNGKYTNNMGGVICRYKGNELRVGSGFSDSQRTEFWNNPTLIVGKTIEIRYQAISHNKLGEESVSFPVFKQIRSDK